MGQDNIQVSSRLMLLLASPPRVEVPGLHVREFLNSYLSLYPNMLLHLVVELEIRIEEYSVHASNSASESSSEGGIALCFSSNELLQIEYLRSVLIATFRVARLTLQTRKLWLVGVATDHNARHPLTCPSAKNL